MMGADGSAHQGAAFRDTLHGVPQLEFAGQPGIYTVPLMRCTGGAP